MSFVDTVGLAAAEQLERSVGPYIALASYKRLLAAMSEGDGRVRAAVGALRCAARLLDPAEVTAVAGVWRGLGQGASGDPSGRALTDDAIDACKLLVRSGRAAQAVEIASAEHARLASARASYLLGRCLEHAGEGDRAAEAFTRGAVEARRDRDDPVLAAALAGRAGGGGAGSDRRPEGLLIETVDVDLERLAPADRVGIAGARLRSSSETVRASGLAVLEDLASRAGATVRDRAIRAAAAHADAVGDRLTAVEATRVAACLRHWRDAGERERALGRLAALVRIAAARPDARDAAIVELATVDPDSFAVVCRARALLEGGGQGSYRAAAAREPPAEVALADLGLEALWALDHGKDAEAGQALVRAHALLAKGGHAPSALWLAAQAALRSRAPTVVADAVAVIERLLAGASSPPRGHVALAAALGARGRTDLALSALRRGVAAAEAGAEAALRAEVVARAWALHAAGDRETARACLLEARPSDGSG